MESTHAKSFSRASRSGVVAYMLPEATLEDLHWEPLSLWSSTNSGPATKKIRLRQLADEMSDPTKGLPALGTEWQTRDGKTATIILR